MHTVTNMFPQHSNSSDNKNNIWERILVTAIQLQQAEWNYLDTLSSLSVMIKVKKGKGKSG